MKLFKILPRLDELASLVVHLLKGGLLMGALFMGAYCFKINYFPQGLSLGESVIFIAICLVCSLLACVLIMGVALSAIVSIYYMKKCLPPRQRELLEDKIFIRLNIKPIELAVFSIIGLLIPLTFLYIEFNSLITALLMLFYLFILEVFIYTFYLCFTNNILKEKAKLSHETTKEKKRLIIKEIRLVKLGGSFFKGLFVVAPFIGFFCTDLYLHVVMGKVGIRNENVIIYIKDSVYASIIVDIVETSTSTSIKSDSLLKQTGYKVFNNFIILFHGVGENTVIEMLSEVKGQRQKFIIPNEYIFFHNTLPLP